MTLRQPFGRRAHKKKEKTMFLTQSLPLEAKILKEPYLVLNLLINPLNVAEVNVPSFSNSNPLFIQIP